LRAIYFPNAGAAAAAYLSQCPRRSSILALIVIFVPIPNPFIDDRWSMIEDG
jgi:hypothetical protein